MALSDVEIWMELQAGAVIIDPVPDATQVNASSVDLHLGPIVQVFKPNPGGVELDLRNANATTLLEYATDTVDMRATGSYTLPKGVLAIGYTKETVTLPAHLCARVEGRSTFARFGLSIHNTAPTIQAGFRGQIALELTNAGGIPLKLSEGLIICQLILEKLGRPAAKPYMGQFQNQQA